MLHKFTENIRINFVSNVSESRRFDEKVEYDGTKKSTCSLPYSGPSVELDFKSDKSNKSSNSVVTYSTGGYPPGTSNIGDLTISI
jgi:hypothetical protein